MAPHTSDGREAAETILFYDPAAFPQTPTARSAVSRGAVVSTGLFDPDYQTTREEETRSVT